MLLPFTLLKFAFDVTDRVLIIRDKNVLQGIAVHDELAHPGTCALGYNSLRFDDEVTRHLLYRNFYDPYAREWQNGNSRWDLWAGTVRSWERSPVVGSGLGLLASYYYDLPTGPAIVVTLGLLLLAAWLVERVRS